MYTVRHAKLRRASFQKPFDSTYIKDENVFKDSFFGIRLWFYTAIFKSMFKKGFLRPYFEDVVIERYDYTETHKDRLSEKIFEIIRNHRLDYGDCSPETHVIVLGEDTFFRYVKEQQITEPFFHKPTAFKLNESYRCDSYQGRQVFDWSAHVVPGLDGIVILPKAIVEVKKDV